MKTILSILVVSILAAGYMVAERAVDMVQKIKVERMVQHGF